MWPRVPKDEEPLQYLPFKPYVKNTVPLYEAFFSKKIEKAISASIKETYPNGEIVIEISCPFTYFEYLTKGWTTFQPISLKPGFHYYRKCSEPDLLARTLPNLCTHKKMATVQLGEYTSVVQIKPNSPIRVMYNHSREVLALSFYHQPHDAHLWSQEQKDKWTPPVRVEPPRPIARAHHWIDSDDYPQRDGSTLIWHTVNEGLPM